MTATTTAFSARDYSLTGPEAQHAIEAGMASAEWYHSDVPRRVMKDLMQRSDGPALRDTAIWIGLLILSGAGGVLAWGTWWALKGRAVVGTPLLSTPGLIAFACALLLAGVRLVRRRSR